MIRTRGRTWQSIRERILKRDNYLCVLCKSNKAFEVDHIIPLYKGGTDYDENLQSLCHDCHASKSAKDLGKRRKPRIGTNGLPVDAGHHWSK